MFSLFPLNFPLMTGFSPLENPNWKQYLLLDAEEKIKTPDLLSAEVRINRCVPHPSEKLPIAASWNFVPSEDLGTIIEEQLALAKQASQEYRAVPLKIRIELLRNLGRRFKEKVEYWRQLTIQESYSYNAFLGSFDSILEIFKPTYLSMMEELLSPAHKAGTQARIEYVPQGVIGVISPQNSSFPMLTHILHGAILTGNAVLIKPPHRMAIVALALVREFNEFLQECGMPDGLISSVIHPNTQLVMDHWLGEQGGTQKINNLIFIGNSQRRGDVILSCQKGGIFNPIIELEGVDAAYIHDDLTDDDLRKTARLIAHAKNLASGQMCISLKRLYVQPKVYDTFLQYLKLEFQKYHPGSLREDNPYLLGPSALAHKLNALLEAFKQNGAKVTLGGKRLNYEGQPDANGLFIEPTLIENVSPEDQLLQQEIFANILPIVKLNGSVSEATQYMNDCPFGLRASIFVKDPDIIRYMTHSLNVGTVVINGNPLDCSIQIAGGRGMSTLDQNARIWPLDMSLRRVVTVGQGIHSFEQMMQDDTPDTFKSTTPKTVPSEALQSSIPTSPVYS